jgi:hypothetical protein
MFNIDKAIPLHKGIISIDTNVPDPNKKVAKGKPKPENPTKPEARVTLRVNGDDGEEVVIVGEKQIAQEGLGLLSRVSENRKAIEKDEKFLKKILFLAKQAGIPVREGLRDLETSETPYSTYRNVEAFEKTYEILSFLISKFRKDFEGDETAQQLLEDAGVFVEDEDGESLRLRSAEEFKEANYANPQTKENFKITVTR